jgi:hypothetical protein
MSCLPYSACPGVDAPYGIIAARHRLQSTRHVLPGATRAAEQPGWGLALTDGAVMPIDDENKGREKMPSEKGLKGAFDVPVLIVGGGPVGLAMAVELGWRGIECVLVEQGDGEVIHPKTNGVNMRTMEYCRRWNRATPRAAPAITFISRP